MDNLAPSDSSENFSDTIFWFLDENSDHYSGVSSEGTEFPAIDDEDDDDGQDPVKIEENKAFWESQEQILQATLCRTTPIESRVRQATKEALIESSFSCGCRKPASPGGCRSCLRREVFHRLSDSGYNCSLRKSKWNSSSDIPSGEHTYIEVVEMKNVGEVRVIVELHFRAEFEIAKAGEDYNRLVSRLPEVFVGKTDRLRNIVKILCGAAKRCMKEKKIHLGPWRKHKYMLAKWLSSSTAMCEMKTTSSPQSEVVVDGFSDGRSQRPKASMLTFALKLPNSNFQVVAVV